MDANNWKVALECVMDLCKGCVQISSEKIRTEKLEKNVADHLERDRKLESVRTETEATVARELCKRRYDLQNLERRIARLKEPVKSAAESLLPQFRERIEELITVRNSFRR